MSTDVVLENVIIVYPDIFHPKTIGKNPELKYSCSFILLNPDWQAINAAMEEAKTSMYGNQAINLKNTIRQCDIVGYTDKFMLGTYATQKYPPQVVDQSNMKIMDQSLIFGGCIVNAWVSFWPYNFDNGMSKGLSCDIRGIQLVDNINVTRIDGRKDVSEVFKPIDNAPAPSASAPGVPPTQQGFAPPTQQGFAPPTQQGFAPPTQQGFTPPTQQGFAPPTQQGFTPPTQQGFTPPTQQGFTPPTQQGFAPSSSTGAPVKDPNKPWL